MSDVPKNKSPESPGIIDRILNVIDTAISAVMPPDPIEAAKTRKGEFVHVQPATFRAITVQSAGELASTDQLAELRAVVVRYDAAYKGVMAHTYIEAKAAWLAQEKEHADKIVAGGSIEDADHFTYPEWASDYERKMEIFKAAGGQIACEAAKLARPIVVKFIETCDRLADEIEAKEQREAAAYGVAFQPSLILRAVRSAARQAAIQLPSTPGWGTSPRTFLAFLDLE